MIEESHQNIWKPRLLITKDYELKFVTKLWMHSTLHMTFLLCNFFLALLFLILKNI
jgi:hypothetical protein